MNSIEQILEANKNIYLWEDESTLDVTLTSDKSFKEAITEYNCPACEKPIIKFNKDKIDMIVQDTFGVQLECKICGAKLFVHTHVSN